MSLSSAAIAATTATQTINMSVAAIDAITVSGNTITLAIIAATGGGNPIPAVDSSTFASITTNATTARKVTASIDSNIGIAGLTLTLLMATPPGATTGGTITLSTTAQPLATGITALSATNLTLTYTLNATSATPPTATFTRTATLTIGP